MIGLASSQKNNNEIQVNRHEQYNNDNKDKDNRFREKMCRVVQSWCVSMERTKGGLEINRKNYLAKILFSKRFKLVERACL